VKTKAIEDFCKKNKNKKNATRQLLKLIKTNNFSQIAKMKIWKQFSKFGLFKLLNYIPEEWKIQPEDIT
jgi:hypothetical protein